MRHDRYTDPNTNEAFLRLIAERVCVRLQVDREMLYRVEAFDLPGMIADRLAIQLEARIFGENLPPVTRSHTVQVPADWRQHWKLDHAGSWWVAWWVRRHPARQRGVTLTTTWENRAEYPFMRVRTSPMPDAMGQAVMIHLPGKARLIDDYNGVNEDLK